MKKRARCVEADKGQDVTNGLTVNWDEEEMSQCRRRKLVGCGGTNEGQDVTIRLVPHGLSRNGGKETLQLLKVHSSHLLRCSKYFETCLSERWSAALSNTDACCDVEFALEVHGDLACYTDCFSQMYSSCRKEFQSVEYSLALLKVASQIEYRDLMDSILRYLSAIAWSDEDEVMIREYASSPDFPRNCAEDLVVRLELDEVEEECRNNLCGMIERSVGFALENYGNSTSVFLECLFMDTECEMSSRDTECEMSSSFSKTVIGIIIKVAKKKFEEFSERCLKDQPDFTDNDIRAMNRILTFSLDAGVAEELVECLAHIQWIPKVLISFLVYDKDSISECFYTTEVVIRVYEEVTSGRLPLRTAERVALFRNWHRLLFSYSKGSCSETIENLFSTLPCKVQMAIVEECMSDIEGAVDPNFLANIVKKTFITLERTKSRPSLEGPSRQQQGRSNEVEEKRPSANDETGLRTV